MPKVPHKDVVRILNDVLTAELTAVNQYFLHAEMCGDWGYARLHDKIRAESIDEMKHAQALIERILYLGGVPNVQRLGSIQIGKTVKAQLENDLALEHEALPRLNAGIETLRGIGDTGSRLLLEQILASEEAHVEWLEAQLALVEQVGLENYLAAQIREEG
jgi:bacterioferritin